MNTTHLGKTLKAPIVSPEQVQFATTMQQYYEGLPQLGVVQFVDEEALIETLTQEKETMRPTTEFEVGNPCVPEQSKQDEALEGVKEALSNYSYLLLAQARERETWEKVQAEQETEYRHNIYEALHDAQLAGVDLYNHNLEALHPTLYVGGFRDDAAALTDEDSSK